MAGFGDPAPGFVVALMGALDHKICRRRGAGAAARWRQVETNRGRARLLRQGPRRGLIAGPPATSEGAARLPNPKLLARPASEASRALSQVRPACQQCWRRRTHFVVLPRLLISLRASALANAGADTGNQLGRNAMLA